MGTIDSSADYTADPGPATVEDFTELSQQPAATVLTPGTDNYKEVVLTLFLQKIGMTRALFDALPLKQEDRPDGRGSSQEAINKAAEAYFRKTQWDAERSRAHEQSKLITKSEGLKYLHFPLEGITLAYTHVRVASGVLPDDDWCVVFSMAKVREDEPFCRQTGVAMAARQFAIGRRIAVNTSFIPGHTKAQSVSKEAWEAPWRKETFLEDLLSIVRASSALFGRRRGVKEDDGLTEAEREKAKADTKARRKRVQAAKAALKAVLES